MSISGSGTDGGGGLYGARKTIVRNSSGGKLNFDFSGLIANLGITFRY